MYAKIRQKYGDGLTSKEIHGIVGLITAIPSRAAIIQLHECFRYLHADAQGQIHSAGMDVTERWKFILRLDHQRTSSILLERWHSVCLCDDVDDEARNKWQPQTGSGSGATKRNETAFLKQAQYDLVAKTVRNMEVAYVLREEGMKVMNDKIKTERLYQELVKRLDKWSVIGLIPLIRESEHNVDPERCVSCEDI